MLNIKVTGYETRIDRITLDGRILKNAFLPAGTAGVHNIEIMMADNAFSSETINLIENKFSLPSPQTILKKTTLNWMLIPGAISYRIYKDGVLIKTTKDNFFVIENSEFAEYKVTVVDAGGFESFCREPVSVYPKQNKRVLELEKYASPAKLSYLNYSGEGFVKISMNKNISIRFPVNVASCGKYLLDIRYSNGTGPWNTDNNCAIRSLYINGRYNGVLVFPQRGKNEWSDWGYSNAFAVNLKKGKNIIEIKLENWNTNMDGKINDAMLDYVRIVKVE